MEWRSDQDALLLRLRANQVSWEDVADLVGRNRDGCISRARALGLKKAGDLMLVQQPVKQRLGPQQPKPAGHPASWQAINAGTILAGEPYPLPVFL